MEGLKITAVELSPEARFRVLETAIDAGHVHGLGYWADVIQMKHTEPGGPIGAVLIHDREGAADSDAAADCCYRNQGNMYPEQLAKRNVWIHTGHVQRAVAAMLADPEGCGCQGLVKQLLTDDLDGPLAEAIVQVACFGKVIYGSGCGDGARETILPERGALGAEQAKGPVRHGRADRAGLASLEGVHAPGRVLGRRHSEAGIRQ